MLYITDNEGNLVASSTTLPPFANKDTAWWKGASHRGVGQLFIEDVHFDDRAQTYVISISLPIMDRIRYEAVGVLHRVIDAKELISPSISPIRFGKTGHVMLIDHRGIVMSCPILPTGVPLSDCTAHSARHTSSARLGQCAERWSWRTVDLVDRICPGA